MKTITLDMDIKQDLIEQFTKYINDAKLNSNHITFSTNLTPTNEISDKPTIYISSLAYLKMMVYIRDTDTEIAWHGTVTRNLEKNYYHIKDVFLYPQIVRAATVDTEQEKYNKWIEEIEDDETVNTMRFQGHSHVNMATSPSGTDTAMYYDFLQMLPKDDYYIFTIMNKRGDMTFFVYDLAKNLIYEPQDLNIKIMGGTSYDVLGDIAKEKSKYCVKSVYTPLPGTGGYNKSWTIKSTPLNPDDNFDDFDEFDTRYGRHLHNASSKKKEDINDYIDTINNKFKNAQLRKGAK